MKKEIRIIIETDKKPVVDAYRDNMHVAHYDGPVSIEQAVIIALRELDKGGK